jgi:DNA-binding NarL/FixJ family response regulator
MAIELIIVDDHRIVRRGMRSLLEEESDIRVVGEAGDGHELLGILQEQGADVVLMDIKLKDMSGIRATERIVKEHPGIRVLGLTMHEDGDTIERMMDAGAMGYVFKDSAEEDLQHGIRTVANGERFFSNAASQKLIEHLRKKEAGEHTPQSPSSLTERERLILSLIAREFTNSEIAEELRISPKTVDGHRRRLLQKFNARNSAGLIRTAMEMNFLSKDH